MPGPTAEAPVRAAGRYQLDAQPGLATPAERTARGKAARAEVPRDSHAAFDPPPGRPDPLGLLGAAGARAASPNSCRCGGAG